MSVHYVQGDLLEANVNYICHQVNCQGKMNSGIAKQIKERWLFVYISYMAFYSYYHDNNKPLLGKCLFADIPGDSQVINMFAQEYYGYDSKRYTSYDAFWTCLGEIKNSIPKGSRIGFPARIGCVRGGANWEVIKTMIEQVLGEDYEVYIYDYDKG